MSNLPLISVIVPIYNVEKYIHACIDSIVHQDYPNLEVILVDDESPDNCPKICENYAQQDSRIKVIHKKNGGLSSARNAGIEVAKGDYIFFLDSDDRMDLDTISFLYERLTQDNSDIATSRYHFVLDHTMPAKQHNMNNSSMIVQSDEALTDALYQKKSTLHAWGKLYKKELFTNVRYPENRLYEDAGTTYKLYSKADSISINSLPKIHYLKRDDSITGSAFSPKMMDSVYFANEMYDFIRKEYQDAKGAAQYYLFASALSMLDLILRTRQKKVYTREYETCTSILDRLAPRVSRDVNAPTRVRIYAYAMMHGNTSAVTALLGMKNVIRDLHLNISRSLHKEK